MFQLSSVSMHYFRKKLSVCRKLNDFLDFEFCPQASVCDGDRILQSLNRVSKWRPAAFLDFVQNKFWRQNFVPP